MGPRASLAIGAGFLALLLAEFLLLSWYPLHPYVGPAPASSHYVVTSQNASRWIITAGNPLGQLTSFMVFDGWSNVENLFLAVSVVFILLFFVDGESAWILGVGLFVATNLAGILSPTAIYLGPPSNYGVWGLSAATFAPVGSVIVGCARVLSSLTRPKPLPGTLLSAALLGLFVIVGVVMSLGMFGPTIPWGSFHIHLLSFAIGGVSAALVLHRIQIKARFSGRAGFQPIENRCKKRPT